MSSEVSSNSQVICSETKTQEAEPLSSDPVAKENTTLTTTFWPLLPEQPPGPLCSGD